MKQKEKEKEEKHVTEELLELLGLAFSAPAQLYCCITPLKTAGLLSSLLPTLYFREPRCNEMTAIRHKGGKLVPRKKIGLEWALKHAYYMLLMLFPLGFTLRRASF